MPADEDAMPRSRGASNACRARQSARPPNAGAPMKRPCRRNVSVPPDDGCKLPLAVAHPARTPNLQVEISQCRPPRRHTRPGRKDRRQRRQQCAPPPTHHPATSACRLVPTIMRPLGEHPPRRRHLEALLVGWRCADSWCPAVTFFAARAPLIMGVVWWNGNLVNEVRPQPLDGPERNPVVRVARNRNAFVNRTDERSNGATSLKRESVAAKRLRDFKSDVPRAQSNMLGIADAEVDVANIHIAGSNDAEMILGNQTLRLVAGNNSNEAQPHLAERQILRWLWERRGCRKRGHCPNL